MSLRMLPRMLPLALSRDLLMCGALALLPPLPFGNGVLICAPNLCALLSPIVRSGRQRSMESKRIQVKNDVLLNLNFFSCVVAQLVDWMLLATPGRGWVVSMKAQFLCLPPV